MGNYIECKVRYDKVTDDGQVRKINESYVVEVLSCSEAEVKITEEMQDSIIGEFEVRATRMSKIAEVWFGSGEDDR